MGFQQKELQNLLTFLNKKMTEILNYYKEGLNEINSLNKFRDVDRRLSLEGALLVKVDRASMLNSIECRSPFLNREIFKFYLSTT